MKNEKKLENAESTDKSAAGTRTSFHVAAAGVAGAILLSMILAVPTCQRYMKHRQTLAIQEGAVVDLQMVLAGEKKFFAQHGAYTTDLRALGIGNKKLMVLYKFGFVSPSVADPAAGTIPAHKDLDALKKASPELEIEFSPVTELDKISFDKLGPYCPDCTATASSFKAIAAANLDDDAVLDVWTIDQDGRLNHVVDDLTQ